MNKTLHSMPKAVFSSALAARDTWYSRLITRTVEWLDYASLLISALSKWVVGPWWLIGTIPPLAETFAASRAYILGFFVGLVLLAFLAFVCNIAVHKPLAQRGWPCVAPIEPTFAGSLRVNGLREAFAAGAAWPALIFGGLLLFSAGYATKDGAPIVWLDAGYAVLSLAIGVAAILLDLFPPTFGVNIPSWNEFHAARAEHERRRTEAQPTQTTSAARDEDYHLPVSAKQVSMRFADIFGMQPLKDKLLHPARAVLADRADAREAPRNGILLHGEPGNGKTVFAEALAGELQVPFIQLTYGDVSSKWLGEMPRVISNVFAYAQRSAPCVLFIDEIDSFITSRDQAGGNAEDVKITNTLLTEIVNLRAHPVVLVGATNYLKNLDAAAIREGRFDFKIEVTPPDEPARLGLLELGLRKHAPGFVADAEVVVSVARRWNGFSVSRIVAVTKAIPSLLGDQPSQTITYDHLMAALREVQGRNGRVPTDTKSLGELILNTNTRGALELVATRLRDAHKIETLGGTLPTGVLFHGPSGTGKTAAARALAKEAGWAFLSVAGPDLLADRKALDQLFTEARDLRPTIVFIDEADDVLRSRQISATPALCNKLLVLMDGSEDRVKDVVVIAATNHPNQIDPALLRAGRFTEKIEFSAPPVQELPRFLSDWIRAKQTTLSKELDVFSLATIFQGHTIADIEGAMQYALNCAVADHQGDGRPLIRAIHLEAAMSVVLEGSADI
jgi:transitional endoplasmic reticulum ATPase